MASGAVRGAGLSAWGGSAFPPGSPPPVLTLLVLRGYKCLGRGPFTVEFARVSIRAV